MVRLRFTRFLATPEGSCQDLKRKIFMKSVLFLCTGNWYRSRLSEILFNYYAMMSKIEWRADSRGLTETSIQGISPDALDFLEKKGLHTLMEEPRNPEAVKVSDLEQSDLIVVLCRDEH